MSAAVQTWHRIVGHCWHDVPTVQTERSCCVCDAGDPCENLLADIEGHDCVDFVDVGTWRCNICEDEVDPADAECPYCNGYPCHCDEAYERLKDERMGIY